MKPIKNLIKDEAPTYSKNPPSTPTPAKPSPPTCPNCGGAGWLRLDIPPGDPNFGKLVQCSHPIHEPDRLSRMQKVSQLGEQDIKKQLTDIQVSDENRAMITVARELISDPFGWLYIWGGPGNAKSEVLISVVNQLNRQGKGPAIYTTLVQIMEWVRQAFGPLAKEDYTARVERLKQIPVLAIDEMDKARDTDWAREFKFHFLDDRYRTALNGETVTLFAGNTNPALFDEPLYDRIRDGRFKIVHNTAASARPHMRR